jgi:putative FmdB family regulatory protein
MPTYEFRCSNGHVVERRFKMSEAASEIACPECGEIAVRQLSGGAGLVFKGSGFYLTDYGRNAHRGGPPDTSAAREAATIGSKTESGEKGGGESKSSESKSSDSKSSDSKSSDSKSSDSKSSESKSPESKSSESKSSESKSSESKSKDSKSSGSSGSTKSET